MEKANRKLWNEVSIAKERLEKYLSDTLSNEQPETAWEFYTFLLEQAKKHRLDFSGYCGFAQQDDRAEAKRRNAAMPAGPDAFTLPARRRRIGGGVCA